MKSPVPSSSSQTRHFLGAAVVFATALLVRSLVLYYRLAILGTELRWLGGSDVPGWMGMARHLSNHLDLSYWLMGARPPLFPFMVSMIFRLGGTELHAAIAQIVIGAATATIGYLLARRLFLRVSDFRTPERLAVVAGIIIALDPASVSSSATLMAEPLFNLFFVALLLNLTRFIQDARWVDLALSAVWMTLAMLTRPTAIYLWLAAPLILVPLVRRWQRPVLVLASVGLAVYMGWSARNLAQHGVFTYSLQTNFSLLFLRAISAEHLATGRNNADLQVDYVQALYRSIGDEEAARNTVPEHMWKFLVAEDPRLYAEMGRLAQQKLIQYWPYAVLGTGVGIWRMFAITHLLPDWSVPVELAYHAALYGLMVWGAWRALQRKDWELLLVTGVPILYITGLTLVAQTSAMDTRMRTSIAVPIVILAVYGLRDVLNAIRLRRHTS